MLNWWQKHLREEIKDAESGETKLSESKDTPPASQGDKETEAEGNTDDYGYEKQPETKDAKEEGGDSKEKKADESKAPEKVEDPATGYGAKPPEVKEDGEKKEDPPKVDDPKEAEILKALGDGFSKEEVGKIKEFAKANELTEKQIKAYGDLRRQEIKAQEEQEKQFQKDAEKAEVERRAAWHKELKDDPTFGGENFERNVAKVEKLIGEWLPDYKKVLTEHKGIVPPYLMRNLAKLAEQLYKVEKLVTGEPPAPPKKVEDKGPIDPLEFYSSN